MKDKVCLVTGATHGVGKETALALARMGATVVIVGRDETKGAAVIHEIKQASGNSRVSAITADLSEMSEVRKLAAQFTEEYSELHVLINNVGAAFPDRQVTPEGFEKTFALNYLSHFLLTNLLLDRMRASGPARIINVSSHGHEGVKLNIDDLQSERKFSSFTVYRRTKLASIIFTYELARRLTDTQITANALHPGVVRTNFERNLNLHSMSRVYIRLFGIDAKRGAKTSVYLASSSDVQGITGKYWAKQKALPSSPVSYEQDTWTRLWATSEELLRNLEPIEDRL